MVMRLIRYWEESKTKCRSLVARLLGMTGKPKRKGKHAVGRRVGRQVGQKVSRVQRGSAKRKSRRAVAVPVRVEVKTKQEKQGTQRKKHKQVLRRFASQDDLRTSAVPSGRETALGMTPKLERNRG